MAEQGNITEPQPTPRAGGRGRVALLLILAVLAGAIAGGLATNAFGQAPMLWHVRPFMGGPFGGSFDPAQVDRHVERVIKHLAVEADATADQQAKLVAIAKGAVNDLLPLREKLQANRGQALDLFTAGNVDRAAIERLRGEQLALVESASKRISQALGDAAEVLNPEQRRTLVDRVSHFGGWWRWHHG
jgi:Spy/CpxP family protein refolding chaperone